MRQLKREVKIGNVTIGGNNPIAVQTMLNVPVEDIEGNVAQAKRCEAAGCQILRVTCPSAADAKCIEAVKNAVNIPIVADIHFDYKAALACADVGVDKIRINPGNIGDDDRVKAVVQACQQKNIPIRIGVNGGSLEKHILAKYGAPVPEAMVESALYHVRLLEKFKDYPEFGLNFDPSHLLWQGVTPHLFLKDFMEAGRVYHVHMKDAAVTLDGRTGLLGSHIDFGDLRRGWNFRSLGHGQVNFEEIIRVLNAYGYDGPLSVEWEDSGMDRVDGATEAAAFVRKVDFKKSDIKFDDAISNG